MTARNRSSRAPRGRVVVVGRSQGWGEVSQPVVHAANLFEAVGEVTTASAAEPVVAVVVPVALAYDTGADTAGAFRRIDPSVRLIVLVATDDELNRVKQMPNGFDSVLVEPVQDGALSRALNDDDDDTPPTPEIVSVVSTDQLPEPGVSQAPVEATPPDAVPDVWSIEVGEALRDRDVDGRPDSEELGDTDLLQAILTRSDGVCGRAMQLIAQQTQWSDVELVKEPPANDAAQDKAVCVEVRFGRRCYGHLVTRQTTIHKLRPWAEWLALWLAMDRGYRDYRMLAYQDELTGAWNRRFFDVFMTGIIRKASQSRRAVTVMMFDIDDFKRYNDDFGHEAGDEVLRETVRLLNSVIRPGDRVCRFGGDEFVVIFADPEGPQDEADRRSRPGSTPPETVEQIAARFQDQICQMKFPKLGIDAPGTLSISGGLATYPWDGTDPESLIRHADRLALESKRKGKNVITFGPGARR